jgi:hypothetical protein
MSESRNDDVKYKPLKIGDIDVSKIDGKAGILSSSHSVRCIEQAQEKEVEVTEGNETGSWQIREKEEI